MKKRFIILVDLSATSGNLLSRVARLAAGAGIKLVVVHQSLKPVPGVGESSMIDAIKSDNKEDSLKMVEQFVADRLGEISDITFEVTTGNLSEAILNLQSQGVLDFVFTGVKHKDFFERVFIGSTAIKLSDHIGGVVISMPDGFTALNLEIMNVAVVQKYPFNDAVFNDLLSISDGNVTLRFFSVVKTEGERESACDFLKQVESRYSARAITTSEVIVGDNEAKEVKKFSLNRGGMLVIQKGSRMLSDVFRRHLVNSIVSDGHLAVVILP